MTQFLKDVVESIKPKPQHILEAHDMADAIFEKSPNLHLEMVEAIQQRLADNYSEGQKRFVRLQKPVNKVPVQNQGQ